MKNLLAGAIALVCLASCQNQAEKEMLGALPTNSGIEVTATGSPVGYQAVTTPQAVLVSNVVFQSPRPAFLSLYSSKTFNNEWALQTNHTSSSPNALYVTDQTTAYVYVVKNADNTSQNQLRTGALNSQILANNIKVETSTSTVNAEDFMLSNTRNGFLIT